MSMARAKPQTPCCFRIYEGISRAGVRASLAYAGVAQGLVYIAPFTAQCFFESPSIREEGELEWTQLEKFLEANRSELNLIMATADWVQAVRGRQDIVGLSRVHQTVDVSVGWAQVLERLSQREQKRRAEALRQGFSFDVSRQDADFFQFYRRMHVPTMQHRYASAARSVQEQSAYEELFRKGMLFRVHSGDEWVAGSVSHLDQAARTLNARLIGVKDGAEVFRRNGAQNFVYHAILEWASSQPDIDHVDFQGCEPFLSKGTFQYKKRFGSRVVIPDNAFRHWRVLIRAPSLCASVRSFLVNNPLLGLDDEGQIVAQYFRDAERGVRADIPFASRGIYGQIIHDLERWHG